MSVAPLLLVTTNETIDEEFIQKMNSDLLGEMGEDRFNAAGDFIAVSRSTLFEFYEEPENLPEFVTTIVCHPSTPYYGPEYARGYWPELAAMMEFLKRRVPLSTVWYGPDTADEVEEVTEDWMNKVWNYWSEHGGREYHVR